MPIDPSNLGKVYSAPPTVITAADVSAFAAALGYAPEQDPSVPPTFALKLAQPVLAEFFADPQLQIALDRTVHADQRFSYNRALQVDDRLSPQLTIVKIRSRGNSDWITVEIGLDDDQSRVVTATATFIVTGAESDV